MYDLHNVHLWLVGCVNFNEYARDSLLKGKFFPKDYNFLYKVPYYESLFKFSKTLSAEAFE